MMRCVGQRQTPIEQTTASLVRRVGQRYRFNNRKLPGSPDLSNQACGWAIFVNGCFWHGHKNCLKTKGGKGPRIPSIRRKFWSEKIEGNRQRDARKCRQLRHFGLRVLIIWECQLRNVDKVEERLRKMLPHSSKG